MWQARFIWRGSSKQPAEYRKVSPTEPGQVRAALTNSVVGMGLVSGQESASVFLRATGATLVQPGGAINEGIIVPCQHRNQP